MFSTVHNLPSEMWYTTFCVHTPKIPGCQEFLAVYFQGTHHQETPGSLPGFNFRVIDILLNLALYPRVLTTLPGHSLSSGSTIFPGEMFSRCYWITPRRTTTQDYLGNCFRVQCLSESMMGYQDVFTRHPCYLEDFQNIIRIE